MYINVFLSNLIILKHKLNVIDMLYKTFGNFNVFALIGLCSIGANLIHSKRAIGKCVCQKISTVKLRL